MTAAIKGSDKEQERCHADDGDDEWQAEAVLVGFWWSFPPQHHVTDSRLTEKENLSGRKQPGLVSTPFICEPFCVGLWPPILHHLPCPLLCASLPDTCMFKGHSTPEDTGLRTVQSKATYLSQVIPFFLQQLIHGLRKKLRCGKDGETASSRVQPRVRQ